MDIARCVWPDLSSSSLDFVARHFGIEFHHHDPAEDAFACAEIAITAARDLGVPEIVDISTKISIQPGSVRIDSYFPCSISGIIPHPRDFKSVRKAPTKSSEKDLHFSVRGSTGNIYELTARKFLDRLRVSCTCQAGQNHVWCKHRRDLLDGDITNLLSNNVADVTKLAELSVGVEVEPRDRHQPVWHHGPDKRDAIGDHVAPSPIIAPADKSPI